MSRQYVVYIHTFPNGKRYVGLTTQSVNSRWRGGEGYKDQFVYRPIKKYGWNNIKHTIYYVNRKWNILKNTSLAIIILQI